MSVSDKNGTAKTGLEILGMESTSFQILDALPDMILVKGPKSKILWANRAFTEYYGMSNEELAGEIDAQFNEPSHTAQYIKDDEQVFLTGKTLDIPEEPVTRHDGEVRIFHTVKTPLRNAEGRVVMTLGISRDITEKLRTRQALDLERARTAHSAKMATVGELAAGVAHEVNTPLAIIHGLSGQLVDEMESETPDRGFVVASLKKIEVTAMRISRIVKGLNKFARDASRDEPEVCTAAGLIEDALSFSRERLGYHGIQLEVAPVPADLKVECNSVLITQVLLNLLTNARDAVIGRDPRWVRIEARGDGAFVEFAVTDGGPGVPAEARKRIFDPFFTTKAAGRGTGLGLSVSKGIVEKHGGTIALDEASGPTRFVVRLPRKLG